MSDAKLTLTAPLAGWSLPLADVPDPVFAERMAGDGIAIDPTGNVLCAPCDTEIVAIQPTKHALTLRTAIGAELILHVGIDSVELGGAGFEPLVQAGQRVRAGEPLLRFDLDVVARRAKSAITPIVVASEGFIIVRRAENRGVAVGDFLLEIAAQAAASHMPRPEPVAAISRNFRVSFEHGIHARPAARIVATLRPFQVDIMMVSRGRRADALSTVGLMKLGIACGEVIEVRAAGVHAQEALAALEGLLDSPAAFEERPVVRPSLSARAADAVRSSRGAVGKVNAVIACRGLAVGEAVQFAQPEIEVIESAEDPQREKASLDAAITTVRTHLESLANAAAGDQQAILAAHVELIQDPELAREAAQWIARHKSAGYAWREAARATVAALADLGDERLRERAADMRDLERQVQRVLRGEAPGIARVLPERAILVADELLPSELVSLDRARIAGICMARGGPTSHVTVIAAGMGIAVLVAAGSDVLAIRDGTTLILDAEHGTLEIDPTPADRMVAERAIAARLAQRAEDLAAATRPASPTDGTQLTVFANIGSLADAHTAVERGAEGCGLLRTEFLFLERREPPGEEEQVHEYQALADALGARPLIIRTMDIGGDKPIAYLPMPREENPALGLRGVRTSLWRPDLLRTQLRAILQVRPLERVRILLPMVTDLGDVRAVRAMVDEMVRELHLPHAPRLGAMVETPACAMLADQVAREVDFLSIGTNDLSQYTLAMDRGHPELAARLDGLHPAVLRLVAAVAKAGEAAGTHVAVCGGLGSDLAAIPILIGLGIREVSAVPAMIPRIKRAVRRLDARACGVLAREALERDTAASVRALVEQWSARESSNPLSGD